METVIEKTILKFNMLSPGEKVIVAFSGGADSAALLHFLVTSQDKFNIRVFAAHVNHCLRGDESDSDETFCESFCKLRGVSFTAYRRDAGAYAKKNGISIEEAGRELRYECLQAERDKQNADKIAFAHTKNDSAETILLNLFRGSGPRGIAGIPPARGFIIRPMIECTRGDVEAYCEKYGLTYRTDSTNLSDTYARNKIRNKFIPYIVNDINPSAVNAVVKCGGLVSEDASFIESEAEKAYRECRVSAGVIDIERFIAYHVSVMKRVLRYAYNEISGGLKDFTLAHSEALLKLAEGQSGGSLHLPRGVRAYKNYSRLEFKKTHEKSEPFCYNLLYNEPVYIKELSVYVTAGAKSGRRFNREADFADTEVALKNGEFQFRSRLPGDRIYFSSINGHKTIKDLFNEKKIPADERDGYGMLAYGSEILWIPALNVKSGKYKDGGGRVYVGIGGNDDFPGGD